MIAKSVLILFLSAKNNDFTMFTTVLRSSSLLHSGRGALSRGTAVRPVSQSVFRFFSADPDETDEEDDTKSESISASKVENIHHNGLRQHKPYLALHFQIFLR